MTLHTTRLLLLLGPVLLCMGCGDPPSPTASSSDPIASDDAYCQLFAKRMQECFPRTKERTLDEEVTRCRAGRATARTLNQWSDGERSILAACLKAQSCDETSACMSKHPTIK